MLSQTTHNSTLESTVLFISLLNDAAFITRHVSNPVCVGWVGGWAGVDSIVTSRFILQSTNNDTD